MTRTRAVLAVLAAALVVAAVRAADPVTNSVCPVMRDQAAVPEYSAEYMGRKVYFCCADCVRKFSADPVQYFDLGTTPAPTVSSSEDTLVLVVNWLVPLLEFSERHRYMLSYLVFVGMLTLLAWGVKRRARKTGRLLGRGDRLIIPLAHPGTFGLLVLAGVGADLWVDLRDARAALAQVKSAPQVDSSSRPVRSAEMLAWAWPQGFHELPKGLRNTYYRGNDERSDKLFNGGKYRTATFYVAVQTADGKDVSPGEKYADGPLRVRLDIVRAPGTANNFFLASAMAKTFLAKADAPAQPHVALTVEKPEQAWSAVVPVEPTPSSSGYTGMRGVWYVCVGIGEKPNLATAVIHYYVQYTLHFQDGVLLPGSGVWMLPVYPSPILNGPTADAEWFSDRPIPEIVGENINDPKLLGVPGAK